MSLKPIKLYSHASGPNPWKINIICEELGIPYDVEFMDMSVVKQKPFTDINPNGRVPAIEDPNTGITLWESGAIIEYLVETYDKEKKLTYGKSPEIWKEKQWLAFQISGQGPYYGQLAWFSVFHSEKIPSAIERYRNEAKRVMGVIDGVVKEQEYLVGDKCTYADLAFITWAGVAAAVANPPIDISSEFPHYAAWMERLTSRPAVKKVLEEKAAKSKH